MSTATRSKHRRLAYVCVALCLLCAGNSTAAQADRFQTSWDDPRVVYQGDVLFTDTANPPGKAAPWQPVTLPDNWYERTGMQAELAWYRFEVSTPDVPAERWGVYLWRYSLNARIYFNDELIADGGSFEPPVARNLHRPLLAAIPSSAWRQGENYVFVHLRGFPQYGHLLPIGVGPYAAFEDAYDDRLFFQIDLSRYLFVITLLVALLAAAIWVVDWRNSAYAYFAAACLAWSLYSLNPFIQNLPFSNIAWLRALHTSIDLFGFLLLMFLHRQLGYKNRPLELGLLTFVIAAAVYYWTVPIHAITRVGSLVHIITNGIGLYLIVFCVRHYLRTRNPEALLYTLMMVILLGVSLHDLLLTSGAAEDLWIRNFLAFNLGAPFVFVALIIYLTWRVGRENIYWESRVSAVTGQLADEYEARETLEREKAAAEERERIYRDLHDDIGSRLLSMVYRAETPQQAEDAREALREMRAMVARSSSGQLALEEVVADWHEEVRRRLEEASIELVWERTELPSAIGAEAAYQLTRVLRELISNVIKHAQARQVRCALSVTANALTILIEDNGQGLSEPFEQSGSGVAGIRRRLADLGGDVAWQSSASGTSVTVSYPLNGGS